MVQKTYSMFLRAPDVEVVLVPPDARRVTVTAVEDNRALVEGEEYTIDEGMVTLLIDPEPLLVQYQIGGDDE